MDKVVLIAVLIYYIVIFYLMFLITKILHGIIAPILLSFYIFMLVLGLIFFELGVKQNEL